MSFRSRCSKILSASPLAQFRVRVRKGPAKGAWWTLLPFSYNWREGGEGDLRAGLERLRRVEGAVCWDFGAHFGIATVGMAMQVGPSGQVASFEPDPVAFRRLAYHVQINGLANVRLFQAAVSRSAGAMKLIVAHGLGSSMSHFQYEDEKLNADTKSVEVVAVSPDQLVQRGEIRLPDLIKVDVQGHGSKALDGSIESIRANLPIIVFSNHSRWELEGARALLAPLGYSVNTLAGKKASWEFLNEEAALLIPAK